MPCGILTGLFSCTNCFTVVYLMQLVTGVLLKKQRMKVDPISKRYCQRKLSKNCNREIIVNYVCRIDSSDIITTIVPDDITRIQVCVCVCVCVYIHCFLEVFSYCSSLVASFP